jgi:hypothetical protein
VARRNLRQGWVDHDQPSRRYVSEANGKFPENRRPSGLRSIHGDARTSHRSHTGTSADAS